MLNEKERKKIRGNSVWQSQDYAILLDNLQIPWSLFRFRFTEPDKKRVKGLYIIKDISGIKRFFECIIDSENGIIESKLIKEHIPYKRRPKYIKYVCKPLRTRLKELMLLGMQQPEIEKVISEELKQNKIQKWKNFEDIPVKWKVKKDMRRIIWETRRSLRKSLS